MSARLLSWCKIYLLDDGDGQGGVKTVVAVRQVERVADEHLRIGTTKSVNGTIRSSRKKRVERINGGVPSTLPFDDFPQWKLAPTSENHRSTLPNLSKDRLEKVYNTWRPIHHSIGQCSGAAAFFFLGNPATPNLDLCGLGSGRSALLSGSLHQGAHREKVSIEVPRGAAASDRFINLWLIRY